MRRPERFVIHNLIIHPLISVGTPFLAVMALDSVMRAILPYPPGINLPQYFLIPLAGTAKVLLTKIFRKEQLAGPARTLEFIYTFAGLYLLSCLFSWMGFPQSFYPRLTNVYPLVLCAMQWGFSFMLSRQLSMRELLLKLTQNTPAAGPALIGILKQGGFDDGQNYFSLRRINSLLYVFFGIGFLGLAAIWLFRPPDRKDVFVWMLLFFIDLIVVRMLVGLFLREHQLYCSGISTHAINYRKRVLPVALALSIAGMFALAFAADKSLLQFDLPLPTDRAPERPRQEEVLAPAPLPLPDLGNIEGDARFRNPALESLIAIVVRILMIAAGAAALLFILSPLFKKRLWRYLSRSRPLSFLLRKIRELALLFTAALRVVFEFFAGLLGLAGRGKRKTFPGMLPEGPDHSPARSRRQDIQRLIQTDRIVGLFLKLISWARGKHIQYHYSQTATAYIETLAARFPEASLELGVVLETFGRAVFSPHPVDHPTMSRYRWAVRKIIRLKDRP